MKPPPPILPARGYVTAMRKADRHGRVDRVAAAVEDLDADAGGAAFLRDHHAVVGEDRGCRRNDRRR